MSDTAKKPLSAIFKSTEDAQFITNTLKAMKEKMGQTKIPSKLIELFNKVIEGPNVSAKKWVILLMITEVEEYQNFIFQYETEFTREIFMKELREKIKNWHDGARLNGEAFQLIHQSNGKNEPKEFKHEQSYAWILDHMQTLYICLA